MEQKKKIKLEEIKVQSFTTILDRDQKKVVHGGGTTYFWCCLEFILSVPPCEPTQYDECP
jgi:hypothetical protein